MDIVNKIKEGLRHFSPAEEKVARFILADINYAANAPINELAEKAQVSHASITRLARTLTCANVRELKLKLAQSAAVGARFISESNVDKQGISHVYQSIHDILALNAGLIKDEVVEQASQYVCDAKHTLIFGVGGGSSMMAQECQNRFFRLGIPSNAHSDPMMMRMTAATVDVKDVVVCLSLGGVSPDVYSAAQIAKEYGAMIIAICPEGKLGSFADFHLPIATQESDYIFKPSASRYVMMAAIDILSNELAMKNQRKSREKLRRLKMHLDCHREQYCDENSEIMEDRLKRLPLGD
ncbi:MurR/RpiR family transcriptional regulator [Thalassotalea profundi]|uniref:Transcriptional regulator n=1 Tax=Thalassotalea profundi TaxID=2036687 RepID=A0ABQ3J4E6_9GAMM|nr:MurR/RpiR family transcriptional regulator [Thalassotalea profundi]GHE98996.1 transcriptional regulator [Thalassotalea profundi]